MKKIMKVLSLLLTFVFAMSVFTGCLPTEQIIETVVEGGQDLVTVQWVWGQKVLREDHVERGSKLTEWIPEITGREFQGWYERPYIKKFDFEKTTVKKSMRIYASFKGGDDPIDPPTPPTPPNVKPVVGRDGCKVEIIHKTVSVYDANGKLLRQESIVDYTKENIRGEYASLDNFIRQWSKEEKKEKIREMLLDRGIDLELMKAGYPPIDIKFTDRLSYYNAFDEYYVKHNLSVMEKLFAGYVNQRLDMYLDMLKEK